ncbi:MAG: sulfatase [Pseudomonadota bacterium]|nr:sulfatase [Pseudomonadota bacterium]
MRILHIDIDSLRPDHLGCYGYARITSPAIDRLAREGVRFDNVYISDAPCLPSRTALWTGRAGFRTGVVGHGGTAAQPFIEGRKRGFKGQFHTDGWMTALRKTGHHTVTVSSFGERHGAWHWYAGYNEIINPGLAGLERADQVVPLAIDWIERKGRALQDWFLHVNLWDPHTPYRTPAEFGNPFLDAPIPGWFDGSVLERYRQSYGPHSTREPNGFDDIDMRAEFPLVPAGLESMQDIRSWIDGYDLGIRYADDWVDRLLTCLENADLFEQSMIVVTADHGENLGELNIWGDHHTADQFTCRIPLIVRMPRGAGGGRVDGALHYHFDWAATLVELTGGSVPESWDGRSFARQFGAAGESGREFVITSQGAWSCQRGICFEHERRSYLCLVTYHDGYKNFRPLMLFDLVDDPHEQTDIADRRPDLTARATELLTSWLQEAMRRSEHDVDPLMTVMREGGPFHCRGALPAYLARLESTGRRHHAVTLRNRHGAALE